MNLHGFITQLDIEIYTTQHVLDELIDGEIEKIPGLKLYEFTGEEYEELLAYKIKRGLSDADHSVIFIAEKISAIVISGDSLVRKTCKERHLEVHGVLWILDECLRYQHLNEKEAHEKLTALMGYNKRLPTKECEERLENWSKKI
jgi:predicted nucleic acid-binding protein